MSNPFSGIASLVQDVEKLDEGNWNVWKKTMSMVFLAVDLEGIADGAKPEGAVELLVWEKIDKKMMAYLFLAISPSLRYLIEDEKKASTAWVKLKEHFEYTSMATRMNARLALYDITHDPSKPLSAYFHALDLAKSALTSLGVEISDTEFKDILLMRLAPSYHPSRLSLLSQKPEPDLPTIKSTLLAASTLVDIQVHSPSTAFAARSSHQSRAEPDPVDDKGFRWCDPTATGVCHRCGRPGHTAARCMFNMPQKVKDWIASPYRRRTPFPPPHHAHQASTSVSATSLPNCPNCGTDIRLEHAKFGLAPAHRAYSVSDPSYYQDSFGGLGGGHYADEEVDPAVQVEIDKIVRNMPHI